MYNDGYGYAFCWRDRFVCMIPMWIEFPFSCVIGLCKFGPKHLPVIIDVMLGIRPRFDRYE